MDFDVWPNLIATHDFFAGLITRNLHFILSYSPWVVMPLWVLPVTLLVISLASGGLTVANSTIYLDDTDGFHTIICLIGGLISINCFITGIIKLAPLIYNYYTGWAFVIHVLSLCLKLKFFTLIF